MNLFIWSEEAVQRFNIWDIGIFKLYLFSVGLIIGAYFSVFVKKYVKIIVAIAALSLVWLLARMLS